MEITSDFGYTRCLSHLLERRAWLAFTFGGVLVCWTIRVLLNGRGTCCCIVYMLVMHKLHLNHSYLDFTEAESIQEERDA